MVKNWLMVSEGAAPVAAQGDNVRGGERILHVVRAAARCIYWLYRSRTSRRSRRRTPFVLRQRAGNGLLAERLPVNTIAAGTLAAGTGYKRDRPGHHYS